MNAFHRIAAVLLCIGLFFLPSSCGSIPVDTEPSAYARPRSRQLDSAGTLREIPDLANGGSATLADDQIIDVVILGDGYLSTEGEAFFGDAERFYGSMLDPVSGVRPYTFFSPAFRVRAVFTSSDERASSARRSYYRVPIEGCPDACTVEAAGIDDELLLYRMFAAIDSLSPPVNSKRYPTNLFVGVGGREFVPQMAGLHSNLMVVMLVRMDRRGDGVAENVPGRTLNVEYGGRRVRVAFGSNEEHEFGHAFANLRDEYIASGRRGVSALLRDPAPDSQSVFLLSNLTYSSDPCTLPWRHLAPGSFYNPNSLSPIGNLFVGGNDDRGVWHCEYRCLMNGKGDNYSCNQDSSSTARNLRDGANYCFWCEEIVAVRILEKTGQLARPEDPTDINARGRTWYQLWDGMLRTRYYDHFNLRDLITAKNACYGFADCPPGQICDGNCSTTNMPADLFQCSIYQSGRGPCGGGVGAGFDVTSKLNVHDQPESASDDHTCTPDMLTAPESGE
jgi:hypothetical protein